MARVALTMQSNTLSISGVLDFETVLEIDAKGQQWLAETAPAQSQLDLANVTYSSSVGIALILGWMRASQKAGKTLVIKNIPEDMLELARVGGLDTVLSGN